MVGYALAHAPDCYRLLNLETKKIILSRDIIWDELKVIPPNSFDRVKTGPTCEIKPVNQKKIETNSEVQSDSPSEISSEDEDKSSSEHESETEDIVLRPSTTKQSNEENLARNIESGEATEKKITPVIDQLQSLMAVDESMEAETIPVTFERAEKESKWKDAMIKELSNIEQRNVWQEANEGKLLPSTKCFGTKWVYTIKKNLNKITYKARLVSGGNGKV